MHGSWMKKCGCALVIMTLCVAGVFPAQKQDQKKTSTLAAVVSKIQGTLMVATEGDKWFAAREGDFLDEGNQLKTDENSLATITFINGIEVKLNKDTVFTISVTEISDRGKGNEVSLSVGQAWSRILKEGTQFDIQTPAATVAIRGSEGDTKVRKNGRTRFALYYGKAYVENSYGKVEMKPCSSTSIDVGSAPEQPQNISDKEKENWQNTISSKPRIKIELEKPDAIVGYPVRLKISALNSAGQTDIQSQTAVRVSARSGTAAFSTAQNGKERSSMLTVSLSKGTEELWVFPIEAGSIVITAESSGYDAGLVRLYAFDPSKKNLEIELQTEDGQYKKLKLKFRR